MATCLCKQPCERHKFPMLRTKEEFLKAAEYAGLIKQKDYDVIHEQNMKKIYEGQKERSNG